MSYYSYSSSEDDDDDRYCEKCGRYFVDWRAREQHWNTVHTFPCNDCNRTFNSSRALQNHRQDKHTHVCRYCDKQYSYASDLEDHVELHCSICGQLFGSVHSRVQHQQSSVHRPKTNVCPFCNKSFSTLSALTGHVESGVCTQQRFGRKQVKQFVQKRERQLNLQGSLLVPRITNGPSDIDVPQYATERSWNGSAYECAMCYREFSTLRALNGHLVSHEPADYRCANCDMRFKVLSAVMKHWEQSSCGIKVAHMARKLVDPNKLLSY
ncbi:uncharacterized protein SPPG_09108 [Spizellomyces punctatus DAOM BR117]|uniref:C2H2-type domain-containing protein n=1 Tax=Spizellomyces punctatus (strain DAOM BR117) TaxID=645134 RepID=A0A0L0HL46_SPIPD|nr:uncharacterized protein SPPG_09108 [Spizellomyces punctatus DAOM BR117]KND01554.1 hypothetical protein SPPG_09108 [Spizellomyces punctatus DAOM BR117]|eukprot:XP_016609593.1 hypothetical protein SPPG_09108 [Spizellomyces punctatus DAOM BR117]